MNQTTIADVVPAESSTRELSAAQRILWSIRQRADLIAADLGCLMRAMNIGPDAISELEAEIDERYT